MRRPNGSGSVIKLSGSRRNKFGARLTVGFNDKGHPIYKFIGYAENWNDANAMLVKYNENRYDLDRAEITTEELYNLLVEKKGSRFSKNTVLAWRSGFKYLKPICKMRYRDIRAHHMRECIDGCGRGYATQGAIKTLFRQLDRLALEYEVIFTCYSELTTVDKTPETSKKPFTKDEILLLWKNIDNVEWVDLVLFLIYTGLRAEEFVKLKKENVDLDNLRLYISDSKTASGIRYVPICSKIVPLTKKRYKSAGKYLFGFRTQKYDCFHDKWKAACVALDLPHTPHEARHTLRSMLDSAGANKVCIDLIVGHKSADIGERRYTHKTFDELKSAIELIVN